MKKKFISGSILLFTVIVFLISCKKERSCEGCKENNKPPIALAGPDQVITLPTDSVLLDGNSSSDPDGTISEWRWTKISGPASFLINNSSTSTPRIKDLVQGVYQIELKVTDNGGLSSKDTVQIIVDHPSQPNRPPVANAGPDQIISLPTNSVILDGSGSSDPDNNITNYHWVMISGPPSSYIINTVAIQTQVRNLIEGTYQFRLKVTDADSLFSEDTVQIIVNNQSPPTPACINCKLVFVSDRDGNAEIYSCNADGSNILRLTSNPGIDEQPAWSPDGTRIAFISDRTGDNELYIMNADGSNIERKTFSGYCQNPAWSPNGTKIAYSTVSNGSANIWVYDLSGGTPSLLFDAPGYDDHPAWSPDGTKLALVSDWMAYDFVYDIYTINANGTGFTALTGNIFDHVDYVHPSWSPTGTKLAFAITDAFNPGQNPTQIGVMNPDGSGLTVISSGGAPWSKTSWSGDGTRIAFTRLTLTGKDIAWISSDGSASGIIVSNGWNADWQR